MVQHAADDPQSVQSDFAKMGAFEAEPYKRTRKTPNEQRQKYHNSGSFLSTPVGPNPQCFEYNLHSTVKNTKPDCTSSACIGSHFSSSVGTIGPAEQKQQEVVKWLQIRSNSRCLGLDLRATQWL